MVASPVHPTGIDAVWRHGDLDPTLLLGLVRGAMEQELSRGSAGGLGVGITLNPGSAMCQLRLLVEEKEMSCLPEGAHPPAVPGLFRAG